jgi:hypothetical protein
MPRSASPLPSTSRKARQRTTTPSIPRKGWATGQKLRSLPARRSLAHLFFSDRFFSPGFGLCFRGRQKDPADPQRGSFVRPRSALSAACAHQGGDNQLQRHGNPIGGVFESLVALSAFFRETHLARIGGLKVAGVIKNRSLQDFSPLRSEKPEACEDGAKDRGSLQRLGSQICVSGKAQLNQSHLRPRSNCLVSWSRRFSRRFKSVRARVCFSVTNPCPAPNWLDDDFWYAYRKSMGIALRRGFALPQSFAQHFRFWPPLLVALFQLMTGFSLGSSRTHPKASLNFGNPF